MDDHLKKISAGYSIDRFNELKLKPMSSIDSEIIDTVITIARRLGNEVLADILSRWKFDSDEFILEQLNEYLQSEDLEGEMKKHGGDFFTKLLESMKKSYITIGEEAIHTNKIFVLSKRESHDGSRKLYSIVINDEKYLPPGTSSWYCNIKQDFFTIEERDSAYSDIKQLLIKSTMCKFLN